MNEFTKDELEFLKHATREHYKNNPPIKGSTYVNIWADMINKIQSIINKKTEQEKCNHSGGVYSWTEYACVSCDLNEEMFE